MQQFERPRVRAEGPGGPDVKQGAKIACLDCRQAKIRCSAPTDGRVPCKRCARHGRECVFEKHRRGRKPGRTNNAKYDYDMMHDHHHHHQHHDQHQHYSHHHNSMSGSQSSAGGSGSSSGGHGGEYNAGHHYGSMPSSYGMHIVGGGQQREKDIQRAQRQQNHFPNSMHDSYGASMSNDLRLSSSTTANNSNGNAWRQPMHSDDPRIVSPRSGTLRPMHLANSQSGGVHEMNRSDHSSPFGRPSLSPPHLRDARSSTHSSYSNSTGGGQNSHHQMDLHLSNSLHSNQTFDMDIVGKIDRNATAKHGITHRKPEPAQQPSISPPSSALPPSSLGSGTTPGRSWLDFPTPGTRSLLSPSHLMSTSISTFPSSGGNLQHAWPGSAITSPQSKRKGPSDYFAGAVPMSMQSTNKSSNGELKNDSNLAGNEKDKEDETAHKKRRLEHEREMSSTNSTTVSSSSITRSLSSERSQRIVEAEEEEEMDQLDEDEVNGGQDVDVLSTPLRLLAHASDAALALRQAKGEAENTSSRPTKQGAATMGLVSPPVLPAPSRWFNSGHLPNVGLSNMQSTGMRSGLLPKLSNVAHRRELERMTNTRTSKDNFTFPLSRTTPGMGMPSFTPPNLAILGRSRSFTAVESANSAPSSYSAGRSSAEELTGAPLITPVTQSERRAEVLGIHTDIDGRQIELAKVTGGSLMKEKSVTATTLDPDAWEYRNGRARSRKQTSADPNTVETNTTTEEEDRSEGDLAAKEDAMMEDNNTAISPHLGGGDDESATRPNKFRSRLGSMDVQRRWEVVRRRPSRPSIDPIIGMVEESNKKDDVEIADKIQQQQQTEDAISVGSSEESEKLGASHQDFFSMGIFHSKMDNDIDLDPMEIGLITSRELERLFDIFFARINPLLTIFDPFLHSVTYVRNRSALLTTVIAALSARLSDQGRDAKLALVLENHWRQKLLPEALLGGYKSVELAQAFLVLAIYHKPTNKLSEDRSWQYLGFAIRIATEIGVNRLTMPNDEVKDNEQVRRRIRNRHRLWISLWLTDRNLSLQTGRPATIMEDDVIANSDLWHREGFALPEDARLVSLVKLTRITTKYIGAFAEIVSQTNAVLQNHLPVTSNPVILQAQENIKSLNFCRLQAITELERWKDIWCVEALDESTDGIQSLAIATFLVKWRPRAVIDLLYFRLHLNSIVLEAMERHQRIILAAVSQRSLLNENNDEKTSMESEQDELSTAADKVLKVQKDEVGQMIDKVALDCWETSLRMIDIVLGEVQADDLSAGPNALAVNVIYGALAALRLSNAGEHVTRSRENREAIVRRCKSLSEALIKAGRTPDHRNGAAAPFGIYLKGIITLWETEHVGLSDGEEDDEGNIELEDDKNVSGNEEQSKMKQESQDESNGNTSDKSDEVEMKAVTDNNKQPSEEVLSSPSSRHPGRIVRSTTNSHMKTLSSSTINTPSNPLPPQYTVGDEIWGSASSNHVRNQNNRTVSGGVGGIMGMAGIGGGGATTTTATGGGNVPITPDAESMDRMWDYLTTYPDASSTFPMSLWQPPLLQNAYFSPATTLCIPNNNNNNNQVINVITDPQTDLTAAVIQQQQQQQNGDVLNDPNNVAAAVVAAAAAANVNINVAPLTTS